MIKKKSKKSKKGTKKVAKKQDAENKLEKTLEEVRKDCAKLIIDEAEEITKAVISQSKSGQLGPVKYAFEVAHIFPKVNDGSEATKDEDCLAKTLLQRLNIPETPVVADQDEDVVTIPPRAVGPTEESKPEASSAEEEEEVTVVG
jgi:hypothetical protein